MKKISKKKIFTIVGIVIALLALLGTGIYFGIKKNEDDIPKQMKQGFQINDDGTVDYKYTDELILEAQQNMNEFDYIGISLIENIREYDENWNIIEYKDTKNVISEINLITKEELTTDTSEWTGHGDVYDLPKLDFYETFGFDYTKYENAFDLTHAIFAANGITNTLESDNIYDDYYDEYGQIYYILNNEAPIIDTLLEGVDYDEIVDKNVQWCIGKDEYRALPMVDYFSATVAYKKNGRIFEKNASYAMYYMKKEESVWGTHIYE